MNKTIIRRTVSILLALAVWQIAAAATGMEMLLPSPVSVAGRLWAILTDPGFVKTILFSMLRITAGCLLAILAGFVLAMAAGRFRIVEELLWPYVVTAKCVPVASFIILCLIWLSFNQLTIFIAFLIVFPVVYSNILQGLKSTPREMIEMAGIYRISWGRRFLYIYLPAVKPYLISAAGVSMGMAWKAGVAAEVIGVVRGSLGEKLYESKIYFQCADLFAWTIVIIILSVVLEKLLNYLLRLIFKGLEKL